jgi:hypothetical protein
VCKSGKCENVLGSFRCLCDDGFSVKTSTEDGCTDDDECALDIYHCDPFAECKNTNGSYDCICREGFTGDGFNCQVWFRRYARRASLSFVRLTMTSSVLEVWNLLFAVIALYISSTNGSFFT